MAPTFVWNIMLNERGGVRLPGSPVAGEGMSGNCSGVASVMSRGWTGSSVPWMAFFRLKDSAASWSSAAVRSLSSALTYPTIFPSTVTSEKKSWSARYLCLLALQSTSGSVNPATWPEASQTFGCMMIEVSIPTMSSRRRTMSFHQQSRMFFFSSAPSGP